VGWTNFGPTNTPGPIQVSGGTLSLGGLWSNSAGGGAGTMQVSGGALNLGGSFHTADIGAITHSGGTVAITGTLDNTGATLALDDTSGSWLTASGSITGGTLQITGAARFQQPLGGFTLNGITALSGVWTMLGGNGATTLVVCGDLNLGGTIIVNGSGSLVFTGPAGTTQNINSLGPAVIRAGICWEFPFTARHTSPKEPSGGPPRTSIPRAAPNAAARAILAAWPSAPTPAGRTWAGTRSARRGR
jgi:hypothetical protein